MSSSSTLTHHDLPCALPPPQRDSRRRLLSRVMQLLGVALLVAAGVFGFLALRKSHSDTVPFPTVSHPLKVRLPTELRT